MTDKLTSDELQELVDRAKRAANAIYVVAPKPVADDVSCILKKLLTYIAEQGREMIKAREASEVDDD